MKNALFPMVLLGLAGCGDETAPSDADVSLDPPENGFQLVVGPFDVPAESELQDCYYFRVPQTTYVTKFEIALNDGTHHMNMFRVALPGDGSDPPFDDGDVQRGCWDSLPFQDWGLLVNSQVNAANGASNAEGSTVWQLPDGVATRLDEGELVMIQTHYVNGATQETGNGRGKVVINFHGMPEGDVTAEMGSMFANNRDIRLPAGEDYSATSFCNVPEDVNLVAAAGHFHSRGKEFTVSVADSGGNPVGDPVYDSTSWDDPPFTTLEEPIAISARSGLTYTCSFHNSLDYDIVFGPHVEFEEHCNLFAYYYPKFTDQGALYCF
jgi:hypothetical protein